MRRTPRHLTRAFGGAALIAAASAAAAASTPAPPFDVAYRAWEIVTQLSRDNRKPEMTGECGRTFRPFVVPALRKQTREEQDAAANACVEAARAVCGDPKVKRSGEIEGKCKEFR